MSERETSGGTLRGEGAHWIGSPDTTSDAARLSHDGGADAWQTLDYALVSEVLVGNQPAQAALDRIARAALSVPAPTLPAHNTGALPPDCDCVVCVKVREALRDAV